MPSQVEKLKAHTSHLLDAFLSLKERYSLLEPMLFNEQVSKQWGSAKRARGFLTLRLSLFLSCAQDIAKLSMDDDKRTPSIKNLMIKLEDDTLRLFLREQYASWNSPVIEATTDPEIIDALKRMELRETIERRVQFDEMLEQTRNVWIRLSTSQILIGFLTIRDKVTAHTEVHCFADKYQFVNIEALGIKWLDVRKTIDSMQILVENLGLIIRRAGFAWDSLDKQLLDTSRSFWLQQDA